MTLHSRLWGVVASVGVLATSALTPMPSSAQAHKTQVLPERPNILVVLVDDMRKDELGPLTFTRDGSWTEFSNASVQVPMCCPSRASILTGRYSSDLGVRGNSQGRNLDDSRTIATVMKGAGYRTGLAGKYLNDYPWDRPWTYVPPGWDYWRADGSEARKRERDGLHSADYLTVAARNFLDGTRTGTPFFLFLAYNQPHLPAKPPDRYEDAPVRLAPWPPNFNEADVSDKPPDIRALPLADDRTVARWLSERRSRARSLLAVDESVRTVLAQLRQRGLLDSTIILFTSDNGYGFGSHRVEKKAQPYEEMTDVPFFVRVPAQPGRVVDQQVSLLDLAPTFADYAGTTVPAARGLSLRSVLAHPAATLPRTWVFLESPQRENQWRAVTSRQYKYVVDDNGFEELYDLASDPYELTNRAGSPAYAARLAQARAALAALTP